MTWTLEEDALLRELHPQPDVTIAEICARLGRAETTIQRRRVLLGLPSRHDGPQHRNSEWPSETVAELTRLWLEDKLSASQIGERIGRSKNAVLGKAMRERLPRKRERQGGRVAISQPVKSFQPPVSKSCAWPIGHPGESGFHFCGGEVVEGKPYCQSHCNVAYVVYKLQSRGALNNLENFK